MSFRKKSTETNSLATKNNEYGSITTLLRNEVSFKLSINRLF